MKRKQGLSLLAVCVGIIGCGSSYQLCASESKQEKKKVIFDVGGVLFYPSEATVAWQLGPFSTVLPYFMKYRSISGVTKLFYDTLDKVDGSNGNEFKAKDDAGNELPNIIAKWLTVDEKSAEILAKIKSKINDNPGWFSTTQEKNLVIAISESVFIPEQFVQQWKPIPGMKEFVQECKNKDYQLSILSNWDKESFNLLKQQHADLFGLFDTIVISADDNVKTLKPASKMFDIARGNTAPKSCVFIDDQEENTQKAKELGLQYVLATKKYGWFGKYVDVQRIKEDFYALEK